MQRFYSFYVFLFFLNSLYAQNITILPNGITPSGSIPKLTYEAIIALPNPQIGDMAIDLTYKNLRLYDGTKWVYFLTSSEINQPSQTGWREGGVNSDLGFSITTDNLGNIYVTGSFRGTVTFGATSINSIGNDDVFIVKYNSVNGFQWAKRAGGSDDDKGYGITTDSNGNIYLTGYFNSIANFNTPANFGTNDVISAGFADIFVAKYSNNGQILWVKRAGGDVSDLGFDICVNNNGEVVITGTFGLTANFNTPSTTGSNQITSSGFGDVFIAKYSTNGVIQWIKRAGSYANDDAGLGVCFDMFGSIVVTGFFYGTANFNTPSSTGNNELTSAGASDIFISKYDTNGNLFWVRRAGGTLDDTGRSISANNQSNSIYLTGYFGGIANFNTPSTWNVNELTSAGESDAFVCKFNSSGDLMWEKRIGGNLNDSGNAIYTDNNENLFVTGDFRGICNFNTPSNPSINILSSNGDYDIFIVKIDKLGNIIWIKGGGGSDADGSESITVSPNGTIYVTGSFLTKTKFGSTILTAASNGYFDIFIQRLNE